jgi:hypothetical protein
MRLAIPVLALAMLGVLAPLAGATNFAVLLCGQGDGDYGCSDITESIVNVAIDDLRIDARELRTGDPELTAAQREALTRGFRVYAPGKAHFGNARFTSVCGPDGSRRLPKWVYDSPNRDVRWNISVRLFNDAGEPVREFTLLHCTPCGYSVCEAGPDGVETEEIEVHIGGLEVQSAASRVPPSIRGIEVEKHLFGKDKREAWAGWAGGEPVQHIEGPLAASRYRTGSPGHKSVGELTLRGAAGEARPTLADMINDALSGRATPGIVLQEDPGAQRPGRKYTYFDCFPVRYTFPELSATKGGEVQTETITVKVGRIEFKT